MKQKLTLFLLALFTTMGAWADGTWYITSEDLTQDGWVAMGNDTPAGVTALGSYTPYYRTEEITITSAASLEVRFKYTSGDHRLDILGVDILDGSSNVVASDYHYGYTGTNMDKNTYLLNAVDAGTYTLRYIINKDLSNSAGNITINTIKYADSYANISQWYVVRVHANQAHYMYYDTNNATTGISFTSSTADINSNNYLWGFVKNGSGVSIYNKAAGNSLAVDNNTPSKMSSSGTSVEFKLGTVKAGTYGWAADAFFSVYQTAGTYLNYQGANLQRWEVADEGSNFMIYAVDAPTNLTAVLTDTNGASYNISYEGFAGMTEPTLTGCDGCTLTNGTWEGNTYRATINFPFVVSSNSVASYTYIGQFHNKGSIQGRTSKDFLWHAESTGVIVHNYDVPTNAKDDNGVYTENEKYKWAIYPSISSTGAITFKIKNSSSGYIASTYTGADSGGHNQGVVSHTAAEEDATPLIYYNYTGSNYAFKTTTTSRHLSVNSVNGGENQLLGAYTGTHDGISVGFYTPDDFATLDANLIAACIAFMPYSNIIGSELGQYSGATSSDMSSAYTTATSASTLKAAELTSLISTLENPASKLTLNLPALGSFYRIKGYSGNYITSNTAGSNASMNGTASANNIIYYSSDGNLIFYRSGYGMYNTHTVAPVGSTLNVYTFSQGAQIGKYYVQSNATGIGTYCYDNTANGTKVDRNSVAVSSDPYQTDWTLESVTSLPIVMNSAEGAYFGTVNLPVAVVLPEGLMAYKASVDGEVMTLTKVVENGVLAANTPVVLYSKDEVTELAISGESGISATGNKLSGTVAAEAVTAGENYVLSGGTKGVGFYKFTGTTMPGFKAYLSSAAGVKAFSFSFEDMETAIRAIENENSGLEIYDISGRRVPQARKGLYIVNGKKVMFK